METKCECLSCVVKRFWPVCTPIEFTAVKLSNFRTSGINKPNTYKTQINYFSHCGVVGKKLQSCFHRKDPSNELVKFPLLFMDNELCRMCLGTVGKVQYRKICTLTLYCNKCLQTSGVPSWLYYNT